MSSWHNRLKRKWDKAKKSSGHRYIFSDGTIIMGDRQAVMHKMARCDWSLSYRVEKL